MECIETFPIQILCLRPGILAAVIITSAVEYKTTQTEKTHGGKTFSSATVAGYFPFFYFIFILLF